MSAQLGTPPARVRTSQSRVGPPFFLDLLISGNYILDFIAWGVESNKKLVSAKPSCGGNSCKQRRESRNLSVVLQRLTSKVVSEMCNFVSARVVAVSRSGINRSNGGAAQEE